MRDDLQIFFFPWFAVTFMSCTSHGSQCRFVLEISWKLLCFSFSSFWEVGFAGPVYFCVVLSSVLNADGVLSWIVWEC